ncbi:superoxide dismutase [secondary endosymbiont of Heteropsylla cubana]|uniref:Superoxide dismutase n=1 Tax=secondary endosymbiont of Heteropsylla cubana TaxID=134287 RepID=J3VTR1_9ENTR|nr:Fe-Mn family superoxide dismutase [secondary endosymbiont of Heteropsylla cubana]AFP85361.1 superoxide dismutase [secondary endosymbiont of Heteropsylla cubana]
MYFTLPSLPYSYDAMEPFFDKKTMEIHHTKHHQTYINNANDTLKNIPNFTIPPVEVLIRKIDTFPIEIQRILRNNAGGHANHSLFWKGLKQGTCLRGDLKNAIQSDFGSFNAFKEKFEHIATTHFGSGWTWLIKKINKLDIISTSNQDNPLMGKIILENCGYPIIGLDLWEHAYYLKYQNCRSDYIKAFWNVVNWEEANERFSFASAVAKDENF